MEILKSGKNYGPLSNPTVKTDEVNTLCGDKVELSLLIDEGVVKDAGYFGSSCAVSKVSSTILTDYIKGKSVAELRRLTEDDIYSMIGFDLTERRKQCAIVVFKALKKALKEDNAGSKNN